MRISVLDVGATTVDLLRGAVGPAGLVSWGEYQCSVLLGEGTLLAGLIGRAAWDDALRAILALRTCAGPNPREPLVAVATSAIREASNGPAFAELLRREHGLELRVLSASEEAALAYRGASSALDAEDGRRLVVDLGGGCASLGLGEGTRCELTASLLLGPIRLRPAFAPEGVLAPLDLPALRALVLRSLAPSAAAVRARGPASLVFCSGAARAARAYAMREAADPGPTGGIDRARLVAALHEAAGCRPDQLLARGARAEHADGLSISLVLMAAIMEGLGIDHARVVGRGLREGVALAEYERVHAQPRRAKAPELASDRRA